MSKVPLARSKLTFLLSRVSTWRRRRRYGSGASQPEANQLVEAELQIVVPVLLEYYEAGAQRSAHAAKHWQSEKEQGMMEDMSGKLCKIKKGRHTTKAHPEEGPVNLPISLYTNPPEYDSESKGE